MAVQKITFGFGFLQIVTSLASIALCARHYSDTQHMHTTISHVAVMFAVRSLPSLSLLVCGIMGVIMSCIGNHTARIVHTTVTAQTSVGIAMNIWFFAYSVGNSPIKYDQGSASRCMIAAIFCLITCVSYLLLISIRYCQSGIGSSSESSVSEKTQISDIESNSSGIFSQASYKSSVKIEPVLNAAANNV